MYEYVITAGPGIMLAHGIDQKSERNQVFDSVRFSSPDPVEMISEPTDRQPERFH